MNYLIILLSLLTLGLSFSEEIPTHAQPETPNRVFPKTEPKDPVRIIIEEKYFYTGENDIATGWDGPWPIDQLETIKAICEVIFQGNSNVPVKISHLKLNQDGTLKCPVEIDTLRKDQEILDEEDRQMLRDEFAFESCKLKLAERKSKIAKIVGLHNKGKLLAAQKDCVK